MGLKKTVIILRRGPVPTGTIYEHELIQRFAIGLFDRLLNMCTLRKLILDFWCSNVQSTPGALFINMH